MYYSYPKTDQNLKYTHKISFIGSVIGLDELWKEGFWLYFISELKNLRSQEFWLDIFVSKLEEVFRVEHVHEKTLFFVIYKFTQQRDGQSDMV